jgi:hypothetical protein
VEGESTRYEKDSRWKDWNSTLLIAINGQKQREEEKETQKVREIDDNPGKAHASQDVYFWALHQPHPVANLRRLASLLLAA